MILLGPQFVLPRSERESCGSLVSFGQQQSQVCEKTQPKSHQNPGSCVYTPRFQRICLYRTVRDDAT